MKTSIPIAEIAVANADLSKSDPSGMLHAWFRLLADQNRLHIFTLLRTGERCVCDIESAVRLPQNLVSHHLRTLREAGAITSRREGRWVYYAVDKATLARVFPVLTALFDPDDVSDETVSCL
jgi:DNA-binding transcriptional ArsR family regulator